MTREKVFSGLRFDVERRRTTGSDGRAIVRDVVVHSGAATIIPVLGDGRIVMIRQVRHAVGRELWELPAGTLEPGEEPIQTARRELIEETGYRASDVRPYAAFYTSPGILTERMHVFLAIGLEPVGQKLDPTERIAVERVDRNDVARMLTDGRLEDGKTIAALGVYFLREPTKPS